MRLVPVGTTMEPVTYSGLSVVLIDWVVGNGGHSQGMRPRNFFRDGNNLPVSIKLLCAAAPSHIAF